MEKLTGAGLKYPVFIWILATVLITSIWFVPLKLAKSTGYCQHFIKIEQGNNLLLLGILAKIELA
jgi:hypothetical protein